MPLPLNKSKLKKSIKSLVSDDHLDEIEPFNPFKNKGAETAQVTKQQHFKLEKRHFSLRCPRPSRKLIDQRLTPEDIDLVLMDPKIKIDKKDQVMIVSFKLPVAIKKNHRGRLEIVESDDFLSSLTSLYRCAKHQNFNFKWVGWPDYIPNNVEEKLQIQQLLKKVGCIPVWIS